MSANGVVDDFLAGPGPGSGGVPDAGADVTLFGNRPGCNSIFEVLYSVFADEFE